MLNEVTVVIPAFNEEEALPLVLGDLPKMRRVIVVNNASTDATAAVAYIYHITPEDANRVRSHGHGK